MLGAFTTFTFRSISESTQSVSGKAFPSVVHLTEARGYLNNVRLADLNLMLCQKPECLTYGMRITWNTNLTSSKDLFSRTAGSFLDATHDINQPLNQTIIGNLRGLFPATPLFVYQPRISFAYQLLSSVAVHGGFGVLDDIIPMQIADLGAMNAPNDPTFVGGIGGQVGGIGIAPGVAGSAVDATANANRSFQSLFLSGSSPCLGIQPGAPVCPLAVSLNTFQSGTLKTPYYYQYNFGVEQQIGPHGDLRVDFVGTRGLHEPYQVHLNGYQTVCDGCFAPFAYKKPLDQRFGNANEFRTDASSNYAGLQTAYTQQWRSLTLRANYTLSHCLDEVSNGGLLAFSTQGLMSPPPGELNRQYSSCDYDVRHNVSAYGLYQIPLHPSHLFIRQMFGGWSVSATAILHSSLPFSVLSQPYIANGNGVFQADGASTVQFNAPAYANRVSGVPLYQKSPVAGVTVAGTKQWLNPEAFASVVDPTTGACAGGDSLATCQFGNSGRNDVRGPRYTNSDLYITRTFPIKEGVTFRFDVQMFNAFNHPNFALPSEVEAGAPGVSVPARFGTLQSTISPPTGLLGVGLGGDSSPRMIAFQGRIEF
jgi:hypothetical protein